MMISISIRGCAARSAQAVCFVAVAVCVAAGPAAPADKPKAIPVVAIKKADGSVVRGQLVASDGAKVTVKPAEGKTFGEPVNVAWADVKSVGNGLTRQKAVAVWKIEHKGQLCDDCHGEALANCDVCKGTGHAPESSADCKTCKGGMTIACTHPKCEGGKIPCPAPCFKKGGVYKMKGGYTVTVSDGHIGEVVKVEKGEMKGPVACGVCERTAKVVCPTCNGSDLLPCPTCKAKKAAADCTSCEGGAVECATCGGSGLKAGQSSEPPVSGEASVTTAPPASPPATPAKPKKPQANEDGF